MPSVSGRRRSTTIASKANVFRHAIALPPSAAWVVSNPSPDSESAMSSRRSASSSTTRTLGWEVDIEYTAQYDYPRRWFDRQGKIHEKRSIADYPLKHRSPK